MPRTIRLTLAALLGAAAFGGMSAGSALVDNFKLNPPGERPPLGKACGNTVLHSFCTIGGGSSVLVAHPDGRLTGGCAKVR